MKQCDSRWSHIDLYEEYAERQKENPPEPECCKLFGCGKKLTPQEKLFGNVCFDHKVKTKLTHEINCYISGMITPINPEQRRCEKRCFYSRGEIKKFIKEFNKEKRGDRKLTNSYFCEECQAYHATSIPKKKSRFFTRQDNFKKNKK